MLLTCGILTARPMTAEQAENAVTGWLQVAAQQFFTEDCRVMKVETFFAETGEPIYYVVYLQPAGMVIVSADDLVEPIIGFSDGDVFDLSQNNPLGALVSHDLQGRLDAARNTFRLQMANQNPAVLRSQNQWRYYINLGKGDNNTFTLMGTASLADIRVPPLIKSKWGQEQSCTSPALDCYNYYVPQKFATGCVATAMAQLMRYYQYPVSGIGVNHFTIEVNERLQAMFTRGGDGFGGAYDWSAMPLDPNCSLTETQREAIGALCYDAGISVGTIYGSDTSIAEVHEAKDALTNIFQYGHAVNAFNLNQNIGPGLIGMINPNLDAGSPVILAVNRPGGGHAVLCDGYGYISSTLYHHLNMGWNGLNDAWYNLPSIDTDNYAYTSITQCIYNIRVTKTGDGEVVSGRIFDNFHQPISNAVVYAESLDGSTSFTAESNDKGIYAFDGLKSNTTYEIQPQADSFVFIGRSVTTGKSENDQPVSGNLWGVDFTASCVGDFDGDGDIDAADFAIFAFAWHTQPGDAQWNSDCDISRPADNIIDAFDLAVFVDNWLTATE
jgi:hypothetical protein